MGDEHAEYHAEGLTKAQYWTVLLLSIKAKLEAKFETSFNECLLNYIGTEKITWWHRIMHALGEYPVIVMVSFGATRIFSSEIIKKRCL
ncbi:hypothetical protein CS542_01125 [Pedobacter sp. IW39]|nr:hypothetical protein CS542_01125 [Pedobacter sp. IW39]